MGLIRIIIRAESLIASSRLLIPSQQLLLFDNTAPERYTSVLGSLSFPRIASRMTGLFLLSLRVGGGHGF